MNISKFNDRKVYFRNSGRKELNRYKYFIDTPITASDTYYTASTTGSLETSNIGFCAPFGFIACTVDAIPGATLALQEQQKIIDILK